MTFPVLSANGPSGYNLTNSLRFRSSASAYLNRTPASAGNRTAWTMSMWVKRGALSTMGLFSTINSGAVNTTVGFNGDAIDFLEYQGATVARLTTTAVYRDPSAWYHVVIVWDSSNGTSTDRIRFYVNGTRITAFSTATYPSSGLTSTWNNNVNSSVGTYNNGSPPQFYFDGYMDEINFIDGQALTPSSFGSTNPTTGVWQPAKYTGTYGTNGFYLPFTNTTSTTTLGNDFSGNGNNWTTNNISLTPGVTYDSMTDVPTLTSPTAANFAVMNPLDGFQYSSNTLTMTNGNLTATVSSTASRNGVASIAMPSGKWYCEFTVAAISGTSTMWFGAQDVNGFTGNGSAYNSGGTVVLNGTATGGYATFGVNDIIGCAFDITSNTVTFYKNNVQIATGTLGVTTKTYTIWTQANITGDSFNANFGQRPFAYTPPSGFLPLNTFNLPSSTIPAGNKFMDALLYTGTAPTPQTVTGLNFQPDFAWVKAREYNTGHVLANVIGGPTFTLSSNTTGAEYDGGTENITAFNSNGISVGTADRVNRSGVGLVAWNWKANGAGVTNTAGSITSTVSANTTSGFSVVTYTGNGTSGASVGHGLNVTPGMYIVKRRNTTGNWVVVPGNSTLFGGSFYLQLNTTSALISNSDVFTSYPNSTLFYLSTNADVNASGGTYVAYCFAPIAGFNAFGRYTGNGGTDGPFIYTGFRPRWLLIKRTDVAAYWMLWDSVRSSSNVVDELLYADLDAAEQAYLGLDFTANGFKIRNTSSDFNTSGGTYIYMAFAENPFKNALAR